LIRISWKSRLAVSIGRHVTETPRSTESQMIAPGTYELLFAETVRSIEAQEASLNELRGRAGIMLAAAGAVSAFLGSVALDPAGRPGIATPGPDPRAVLALVMMMGSLVSFIAVLWPMKWTFRMDGMALLRDYVEASPPASLPEMHRSLAWYSSEAETDNDRKLDRLYRLFSSGSVLFAGETLIWLVVLMWKA
jgi:hypothetical protein